MSDQPRIPAHLQARADAARARDDNLPSNADFGIDPSVVVSRQNAYAEFSTPLMEIQSSVMPLSITFDVVAYLQDHSVVEMFDMIQRLKAACE